MLGYRQPYWLPAPAAYDLRLTPVCCGSRIDWMAQSRDHLDEIVMVSKVRRVCPIIREGFHDKDTPLDLDGRPATVDADARCR
jgi:hypothetical protein